MTCCGRVRVVPVVVVVGLAGLWMAGAAIAGCPEPDEILRRIEALDLSKTSLVARFEGFTPASLYRKASRKPEQPFIDRVDKRGYGVLVTELPLEQWWQAINDENRHEAYVPVGHSEVVAGAARGDDRLLFQYAKMFGIGRWWVSRIRMNPELYRASNGTVWEFWWQDDFEGFAPDQPPVNEVSTKLPPIESTKGSWMLARLGEGCTLVELFSWSRAGGAVGALEGMATTRSLRSTLNGLHEFAAKLDPTVPAVDPPFVRPDGVPLPVPRQAHAAE